LASLEFLEGLKEYSGESARKREVITWWKGEFVAEVSVEKDGRICGESVIRGFFVGSSGSA